MYDKYGKTIYYLFNCEKKILVQINIYVENKKQYERIMEIPTNVVIIYHAMRKEDHSRMLYY